MVLEVISFKSFNFRQVGGQKHIGVLLGCLLFVAPSWANNWVTFKFPESSARLELTSLPLVPAPLEKQAKPLWFHVDVMSTWAYPTEAEFVAYPAQPAHSLWVAVALEKYQTRLLSPADYPYILAKKTIPLY
jgi:hypothetical protein